MGRFWSPQPDGSLVIVAAVSQISVSSRQTEKGTCISVMTRMDGQRQSPLAYEDLSGVTLFAAGSKATRVIVDGHDVSRLQHNPCDSSGYTTLTLPWSQLTLPDC